MVIIIIIYEFVPEIHNFYLDLVSSSAFSAFTGTISRY